MYTAIEQTISRVPGLKAAVCCAGGEHAFLADHIIDSWTLMPVRPCKLQSPADGMCSLFA